MSQEIPFYEDCIWWKVKLYCWEDFFHYTTEKGWAYQNGRRTKTCKVLAKSKEQAYEIAAKAVGWWDKEGFRRGGAKFLLDDTWYKANGGGGFKWRR